MKLVYPEIDTVITFREGLFSSIVIENPGLFYRFIDDLHHQSCGYEGSAVLSADDTPISISGNLDLLTDFFSLEINKKSVLNKIFAVLEKQVSTPEFYERSQCILGQIEKFIYDLAFQNDLELEPAKLSITSLLKASGIALKEDYLNLAEKLLTYMDLISSNGLASLFVLVNLRSILDDAVMELFTDSCCRKEYNILLVDSKVCSKLSREQRVIIDADLCEI